MQLLLLKLLVLRHLKARKKRRREEEEQHRVRKRIKRCRAKMMRIIQDLGPHYFRRAYRMPEAKFWELVQKITPRLSIKSRRASPNGYISPELRVSAALRYMAGGSVYDIITTHGFSHSTFFASLWATVSAINKHPDFVIQFPTDHNKQLAIARGFQEKSTVNID